jgi:hypothetical protein
MISLRNGSALDAELAETVTVAVPDADSIARRGRAVAVTLIAAAVGSLLGQARRMGVWRRCRVLAGGLRRSRAG